jgi:FKBP-type peptidyl-prolyl cis-trans isomerase FklB
MRSIIVCGLLGAALSVPDCALYAAEADAPLAVSEKAQYAIGVDMARKFKQQGLAIDPELIFKGMRDGFSGKPLTMTDKDIRKHVMAVQTELRQRQAVSTRKNKNKLTLANYSSLSGQIP